MPASDNNANAHTAAASLSIAEQLRQTDEAYFRGAREECIRMVGDIYAYFDKAAAGLASCCTIATLTAFQLAAAIA